MIEGIDVLNVREGFVSESWFSKTVNRGMCVLVDCGGVTMKALLDSGCRTNVVFKNAFDKMKEANSEVEWRRCQGYLEGIGGLQMKVHARFRDNLELDGMVMDRDQFYVLEGMNERYDMLLGYKFMKKNRMKLYPHLEMVEIRMGKVTSVKLYLDSEGKIHRKIFSGVEVYALEDIKLPREEEQVVTVKVGFRARIGEIVDSSSRMYMIDGSMADYRVKRCAHVFDGILDMSDPKVCLQVCGNVKKKRWRSVNSGDMLGVMSSVVDVDELSYGVECDMVVESQTKEEWTKDSLREKIKLNDGMSEVQKRKIYEMLWERRKVLSQGDEDFGTAQLPEFKILLTDDTPIYQRPRHFPPPVAREIEEQCEELERVGVIEPSESAWNSPIVPIRKPDGRLRMCIDYRKVNDVTVKDRFPMRVVSECVYSMYGMKVFTKLDLVRGYYQMPVAEESRHITAFSTGKRHYQFRNLSFGLANAPAAFQRAMNVVLSGFPGDRVLVFLDDILIMGRTIEEHMQLVNEVLLKLEEVGVKVKLAKCEWFENEVEFLGHMVSESGLRKSEKFVKKVKEFPKPKTVRELRSFLGLMEFGRKFIKDCSGISKPLSEWTGRKRSLKIVWDERMNEAFERLREEIAKDVELAYPDYSEDAGMLEVYTDASGFCMGGCLMQAQIVNGMEKKRVIAYVSKAFNKAEKKYSTIERELAALRFCLKSLRPFLYGIKFVVKTDHQPLVYLQRMKLVDSRMARTIEDLSDFNFEIEYLPGEKNVIADLMSRMPESVVEGEIDCMNPEYLPKGLMIGKECKGGGDSMFESVWFGLKDLMKDGLVVRMPDSIDELRREVMSDVLRNSESLGLNKCDKYKKELRAMMNAGVLPFQEVLLFVSKRYKVIVCVHFGGEKPLIYRDRKIKKADYLLHLQCLSGIHYNWVIEKRCHERIYEGMLVDVHESESLIEFKDLDMYEVENMIVEKTVDICYCKHSGGESMTALLSMNGGSYCGLIDTGSQISLVCESVVKDMENFNVKVERRKVRFTIKGLAGKVIALEEVILTVSMKELEEVKYRFVVLKDKQLPYCFVIGIDFLRVNELCIDIENEVLLKNDRVIVRLQGENVCMVRFVGIMDITNCKNELLSLEDIEEMQLGCSVVRILKWYIWSGIPAKNWDEWLDDFRRYAERFVICEGIVYFSREYFGELMYVPVFSVKGSVGMCLLVHNKYGHMGKFKLIECMKERIFSPYLRKICTDVATTCDECQKGKYQRIYASPPVLKLCMNEPFELVVIDCVTFPKTSRGNVGVVVMVDHKSKFAYGMAVKNKTSENVARVVSLNLLPMCISKPIRMLSDNGPEFVGKPFEQMLSQWGIIHVLTTPYMPSANGLAERTIRTLSEILRMMTVNTNDWDICLGRALWTYNVTVQRSIGMSPSEYVMNFERYVRTNISLNEDEREVWKQANQRFDGYEVGDKVLKEIVEKGRLNVNKLCEKYEGPFRVKRVSVNGLSYVLEGVEGAEIRAHYSQLRRWREAPEYIREHRINELLECEKETLIEETDCEEMEDVMKGKQFVLVETCKRKKRKKQAKTCHKSTDYMKTRKEKPNILGMGHSNDCIGKEKDVDSIGKLFEDSRSVSFEGFEKEISSLERLFQEFDSSELKSFGGFEKNSVDLVFRDSLRDDVQDVEGFVWSVEGTQLEGTYSVCKFPLWESKEESVNVSSVLEENDAEKCNDDLEVILNSMVDELCGRPGENVMDEVSEEDKLLEELENTISSIEGRLIEVDEVRNKHT